MIKVIYFNNFISQIKRPNHRLDVTATQACTFRASGRRENVIPLIKRESVEVDATVNTGEKEGETSPQESVISETHRPLLCNNESRAILALRLSMLRFCYYSFLFSVHVSVYEQ